MYQRAFYYPFPKVPLTEKGVLAFFGNIGPMKQLFDEEDLPATWPAFHSLTMDDKNRLWVSTFVAHRTDIPMANQMSFKWLVLAPTGKLLATFRWPQSYKLEQVKNGNAYTLQRDKKTGLQSVVKYHINMDSSKQ